MAVKILIPVALTADIRIEVADVEDVTAKTIAEAVDSWARSLDDNPALVRAYTKGDLYANVVGLEPDALLRAYDLETGNAGEFPPPLVDAEKAEVAELVAKLGYTQSAAEYEIRTRRNDGSDVRP